ncbi:SGNH/GDSL hydrolase family protein [Spirosoma sp. BT702]|uniref:SGNH/GDSL hydrolase family protein n=1 Tax=Spirosoma profusum TaxID=2771354 RepID=A0A927AMN3_9BACT|nr:SGNH/GDSL hydrolase family protein [Spirosoma profusum]MBD2700154.1 SGNH/GDSL hydrolase family protein [Spirosoma profusum]
MKSRLLFLLLLIPQLIWGQSSITSGIGYPQYFETKPSGEVIYYRVQRDYGQYPAPANNAQFEAYVQGCVDCKVPRVAPIAWAGNVRITYLADSARIEVESSATVDVQLSFNRYDDSTLIGRNNDGVLLQNGTFYGSGNNNKVGYGKVWKFGKRFGVGGIKPFVPLKLIFKNVATGSTYTHVVTPVPRAAQSVLFLAAGNSSPPSNNGGPSWFSARYTYVTATAKLDIEGSGEEGVQLQIERVDGQAMALANTDNPVLSSGVYYGYGGLSGQGNYNKQWSFARRGDGSGGVPSVPLKLSFKRSNGTVYSVVFTPTQVTRQQLFNASTGTTTCDFAISTGPQSVQCGAGMTLTASVSGADASGLTFSWVGNGFSGSGQSVQTTAPSANGTYAYVVTASKSGCEPKSANAVVNVTGCGQAISYNNILVLGNSITHHGPLAPNALFPGHPGWRGGLADWGMDASAPEKDYFHILGGYFKQLNPSAQVKELANFTWSGGNISVADGPYWEQNYWRLQWPGGLDYLNNVAAFGADIIVWRLGENVGDDSQNFIAHGKALINKLKKPTTKVIITGSTWYGFGNQTSVTAKLQQLANEEGYVYVDLSNIPGARAGYENHPTDAAMQVIADRIWAAVPKGTTGGNTVATMAGGYGEGSLTSLMAYAPFVPTNNQISSWPQGNTTQYIEKDGIKFGILKSVGGSISHLSINGGENLINTNSTPDHPSVFEGVVNPPDVGRSGGISIYAIPRKMYLEAGQSTANCPTGDVGWNLVQGGSHWQQHSKIHFFEKRTVQGLGEVLYTKTQPYQWGLNDVIGQSYFHSWYWLEGTGVNTHVKFHYIIELNRPDNQKQHRESAQELPFIYTIATKYHYHIYKGNNPGTGGSLTEITPPHPSQNSIPQYQEDTGAFTTSEPWIGSTGDDGVGVFLVTPWNSRFHGKQFLGRTGNEFSGSSSYINSAPLINFDQEGVYAYTGSIYAGSMGNFRNFYNSTSFPKMNFDFTFSGGKMCGWAASSSPGQLINNQFVWNIGHKRAEDNESGHGRLRSPFGSWKSADLNNIYIKGVWSTNVREIRLDWQKAGQTDSQTESQYRHITVNGTGSMQTIVVNMAGYTSPTGGTWDNSIITNISITSKKYPENPIYIGNETFTPAYIGTINPN